MYIIWSHFGTQYTNTDRDQSAAKIYVRDILLLLTHMAKSHKLTLQINSNHKLRVETAVAISRWLTLLECHRIKWNNEIKVMILIVTVKWILFLVLTQQSAKVPIIHLHQLEV